MPRKRVTKPVEAEVVDEIKVSVEPSSSRPSTMVQVTPGDPVNYLESKRGDYINELEIIALETDNPTLRVKILTTLLNYSSMGQKKTSFNQSNVRQEVHLHGDSNLPDFNHLPTTKLKQLLGQLEEGLQEGQ
jgi:hypothetical protein